MIDFHHQPGEEAAVLTLDKALNRAASAQRLIVATDFDGTIAELCDDPDDARAIPGAARTLESLAALPGVTCAVLSGRLNAELALLLNEPRRVRLLGNHGLEDNDGCMVSAHSREVLAKAAGLLEELRRAHPGMHLVRKPLSLAFSFRQADVALRERLLVAARDAVAPLSGLTEAAGTNVLEFLTYDASKGRVLWRLRRTLDSAPVVFLGDDLADEEAFASLRSDDVGIKVGPGPSCAPFRVFGPDEALAALRYILLLRGPPQ